MKKVLYNLFFPLCIIFILLASIITISLNRGFYSDQYAKNNAPIFTGLSLEALDIVTDNLLNYLSDKRDNLDMQAEVNGDLREVFDQREKDHMVDVKKLYLAVVKVEIVLAIVIVLAAVAIYKTKGEAKLQEILFSKYKKAIIVCALVVAVTATVFAINFNWFWTNFHLVFFSNDLWILDPAISVMINMFPLEFFFSMCKDILVRFFAGCIIIYLALYPKARLFSQIKAIRTGEKR